MYPCVIYPMRGFGVGNVVQMREHSSVEESKCELRRNKAALLNAMINRYDIDMPRNWIKLGYDRVTGHYHEN